MLFCGPPFTEYNWMQEMWGSLNVKLDSKVYCLYSNQCAVFCCGVDSCGQITLSVGILYLYFAFIIYYFVFLFYCSHWAVFCGGVECCGQITLSACILNLYFVFCICIILPTLGGVQWWHGLLWANHFLCLYFVFVFCICILLLTLGGVLWWCGLLWANHPLCL